MANEEVAAATGARLAVVVVVVVLAAVDVLAVDEVLDVPLGVLARVEAEVAAW